MLIFKNSFCRKRFRLFGAVFLCSFFFIVSCDKKNDIIGNGLEPNSEKLGLFNTDTFTIIAFSELEDSIKTDEKLSNLAGSYNDPVFGLNKAAFYTQLAIANSIDTISDTTKIVIDSVILSLAYSEAYGSFEQQTFEVYELNEDLNLTETYYSQQNAAIKPTLLGAVSTIPNITTNVIVGKTSEKPQLRIPLNLNLGKRFLFSNDVLVKDDATFKTNFKGIKVVSNNTNQTVGTGAILSLKLLDNVSRIRIYYRDTALMDTSVFHLKVEESCARFNNFKRADFQNTIAFGALNNTEKGKQNLYIQSMIGMRAKISIPNFYTILSVSEIVINKAELIVTSSETDSLYPPHTFINIVTQQNDSLKSIADAAESSDHFNINYNPTTNGYKYNITQYLQNAIKDSIDNEPASVVKPIELFLISDNRSSNFNANARRSILNGTASSIESLKLVISYTPIN